MMTVTLSQDMWNNILVLLAEHPYKQSAQLIQGITNCLREQMQDQQPQRTNGEALRPGA
jgi:hypothetical protein